MPTFNFRIEENFTKDELHVIEQYVRYPDGPIHFHVLQTYPEIIERFLKWKKDYPEARRALCY